jgi:hypothetical protein
MKASELWWRLLILAAFFGFAGIDGLVGIIGKAASSTFGQTLAGILVAISVMLAAVGLVTGMIRFLKWAWKD